MRRRRHFRGIRVRLECGCWTVIATSFYRIDRRTQGVLLGGAVRRGVWCENHEHPGAQMIQEVGPTVRLDR